MPRIKLDAIDIKILNLLQEDASVSNIDLAELVGLSQSPCLRRVRALEEAGIISKRVTLIEERERYSHGDVTPYLKEK